MGEGAYGVALGARFRVADPPSVVASNLLRADLAVTELEGLEWEDGHDAPFVSGELPYEDAFLAGVMLRDHPRFTSWADGKPLPVTDIGRGQLLVQDLRRAPRSVVDRPFHSIQFYLPRSALHEVADSLRRPLADDLAFHPGEPLDDAVLCGLAMSIQPALRRPEEASQLYVHHVLMAVAVHMAQTYSGFSAESRPRGGLAPWQVKRACELLSAHLNGDLPLKAIAQTCGLSPGYFSRAFREATGVAPHKWLLQRRVEVAQDKMSDRNMSLAEVAFACGFADQSHMTRVFTRLVGVSPGAWRRRTCN